MLVSTDFYLGAFLVISGFILSLLNLQRLLKHNTKYFPVLLSENVLLMCIGVAFTVKSVYEYKSFTIDAYNMNKRTSDTMMSASRDINCNFRSVIMNYGPFIVSIVNSFITLIIDNYMHYSMVKEVQEKEDENTVQEIGSSARIINRPKFGSFVTTWKKYFSFIAIGTQWVVPILMALSMYPIRVTEKMMVADDWVLNNFCMTMLETSNSTCVNNGSNEVNSTIELRKYLPDTVDYFQAFDVLNDDNQTQIKSIIDNVNKIIANLQTGKNVTNINETRPMLYRKSKSQENCLRVCFMETKDLISFMVVLVVVSFFVPITISTVILTKIHLVNVKKNGVVTYVTRELLYNILFWTPVMFDTLFSLIFCSFSNHEVRTSVFTIIANIYQAVKNFMNTKYFKDNSIVPVV